MGNGVNRRIAINLVGGSVAATICAGMFKQSVSNALPLRGNQHYTALLTIDGKTDTDKLDARKGHCPVRAGELLQGGREQHFAEADALFRNNGDIW